MRIRKLNRINDEGWVRRVHAKFGSKCNCSEVDCWHEGSCEVRDRRVLQVDHVHGGGVKELRTLPKTARRRKILADKEGNYQLLCANCNWSKKFRNNENRKYEK